MKDSNDSSTPYEQGLKTRRSILGDAWVDQSLANKTEFNSDFQEFITEYAWDGIWNRPGLDRKTRRFMVLSVTLALGRWDEFELHVRAALTATDSTALTAHEIKEVLMQNAIYAGIPVANTGFKLAQKILDDVTEGRSL